MKVYEKLINDIADISSGLEMAGFLDGIQVAAIYYCIKECPEEIVSALNGRTKISIAGMTRFLESEA